MAQAPAWKVYNGSGEYLASFKYPEHAAALVASFGVDGVTIRWLHRRVVWTEGKDGHANESNGNKTGKIKVDTTGKVKFYEGKNCTHYQTLDCGLYDGWYATLIPLSMVEA